MPIIRRPRPNGDFSPRENVIIPFGNPNNREEVQELLEVVGDEPVSATSDADFLFAGDDLPKAIYGLEGNDDIYASSGPSLIFGNEGDDNLNGGIASDTIFGGPGDDRISSSRRINWLLGNEGDDRIFASGSNIIYGGKGDDRVTGGFSGGSNVIYGDKGDDRLEGDFMGNDTIYGGEGNDNLEGYFGDDWLYGGDGWDFLVGNGGADTLQVSRTPAGSFDVIRGFEDGVDLVALDNNLTYNDIIITPVGEEVAELSERYYQSRNPNDTSSQFSEADLVIKVADTDEVLAVIRPIIFVPDGVLPFPEFSEDDFISI